MRQDVCSITLAAGLGSRMPADSPPKSCCRIGPVSVIENAFDTYEEAGVYRHVVVVGRRAEEVMAEVSHARPGARFAFQARQRGTGDAVRCGLDLLTGPQAPEHILISAGDKVVEPRVVRGLMEAYGASGSDLCCVVGPSERNPGSGRVVERDGQAVGIVEVADIEVALVARALRELDVEDRFITVAELREFVAWQVRRVSKLGQYVPALGTVLGAPPESPVSWDVVAEAVAAIPDTFSLPVGQVGVDEAAAAEWSNLSVYAGRFDLVREAVARLGTDNVQGECYFTDVVGLLAAEGCRVTTFRVQSADDVMAFNTAEDLGAVRRVHAVRAGDRREYPPLERWANYLASQPGMPLHADAVRLLAAQVGGDRSAIVASSPGRINLMGRHVDHQGGMCNQMAIDREIVIAAAPRNDDQVNLWNANDAEYPHREFTFGDLMADIDWDDWLHTLDSQFLRRMISDSTGDWVNYVKGAALRLQHHFRVRRLRGMDAMVLGNIPGGAGLSSSSALVVAVTEVLAQINALNVRPRELVDLCGEAEWFVGTRGGSADHAAIKLGGAHEVVSVSFFPFRVVARHPVPEACRLIVCHSGISAHKADSARERFNTRVACYHMAREVIRREHPEFAERIEHLRDINTRRLDVSLPALYALIGSLPRFVAPDEVRRMAAEYPTVAKCVAGVDLDRFEFPLRDVVLYGVAECERARRAGDFLDRSDVQGLGRMMTISHDGDRVATWRPDRAEFAVQATDEHVADLVARASAVGPLADSGAALWQQSGAYACSMPGIDLMVDRAMACPGVLGAQLSGAGLGGCIMVLADDEGAERVQETLPREYYEPEGIEPRMFVCRPAHGSRVLTTVED